MQQTDHCVLLNPHDGAISRRRRGCHADGLTGQAAFAEEVAWRQRRDDRLFPVPGQYRELDLALEDVEYGICRIPLREESLLLLERHDGASISATCEEGLEIEPQGLLASHHINKIAGQGCAVCSKLLTGAQIREFLGSRGLSRAGRYSGVHYALAAHRCIQ